MARLAYTLGSYLDTYYRNSTSNNVVLFNRLEFRYAYSVCTYIRPLEKREDTGDLDKMLLGVLFIYTYVHSHRQIYIGDGMFSFIYGFWGLFLSDIICSRSLCSPPVPIFFQRSLSYESNTTEGPRNIWTGYDLISHISYLYPTQTTGLIDNVAQAV